MRFTSKLISLAIILALCNSPVMTLRLYLVRIFKDQFTKSFFDLLQTFCSIPHPRLMISVSRNSIEIFPIVNLCWDDKNLVSENDNPVRFSFFEYTSHLHIFYKSVDSLEQRSLLQF